MHICYISKLYNEYILEFCIFLLDTYKFELFIYNLYQKIKNKTIYLYILYNLSHYIINII
jgi:hypothetical protein